MKRIGLSVLWGLVVWTVCGFAASNDPLRITAIAIEGNNVRVTWQCTGTNAFELLSGANVTGISNHVDSIYITTSTIISTNLVEFGGATNSPARFYRVRMIVPG